MARGHLLVENAERLYQPETSAPAISLVSAPGDVDGDGLADVLLGGPSDGWVVGSASVGSGRAGLIELISPTWRDDDENGLVVAAAGDVDGDGFGDVLAGHPGHAEVSCWWGGATRDAAIYTGRAGTLLGSALAGAGDLDGDGADDLVLAANCGGDGCGAGMLYVLHGPTSADAAVDDAADSILSGLDAGAAVRLRLDAHSARGGDYDGDGRADLLVGVDVRGAATTVGAAYIHQDVDRHVRSLGEAIAVVDRPSRTDLVSSLAWVGDIDGDGATDVAIGSANDETGGLDAGAAWVLTGAPLGAIDPNALPLTILGSGGAGLGVDVAGGMDLDRDGVPELFIGAPGLDPAAQDAGAVYRFSGAALREALQTSSR